MQMRCFCLTVLLSTINTMAHAVPLAENANTPRLKRQFDFGSIFNPSGGDFDLNPFARPQSRRPGPGEPLIFSNDRRPQTTSTPIMTAETTATPQQQQQSSNVQQNNNNNSNTNTDANVVFINNRPMIATIAPFTAPTTSSPLFLNCFGNCPTTSEYNPICASNQQQYQNPQKFDCARLCGAGFFWLGCF
ncbi:uncharacterized protein [Eurosta solidaginis]|uniref:uncharacterized protein isoform X2 n=1 Tax=Eurosta solidaginis TaxID=178769 RepID=UPI0035316E1D